MELVISAVLALVSLALVLLAARGGRSRELALGRLLRGSAQDGPGARRGAPAAGPAGLRERWLRWIEPFTTAVEREAYAPLRARLAEAGLRGSSSVAIYMGSRALLALGCAAAALPLAVLLRAPSAW